MSTIEWTDETWNPTVGCSRVSAGCDNCYAEKVAARGLQDAHRGLTEDGKWTGEVRCLPDRLDTPLRWRKPRRAFVDSMSDLFHPDVPNEFIAEVYAVMAACPQHTFQVLTKRPHRMMHFFDCPHSGVPEALAAACERLGVAVPTTALPNVWLGVSVENQRYADLRIPHLLATPAAVRFLSCEPLLGPVVLDPAWLEPETYDADTFSRVHWVIVGGESGPSARPMDADWVRDLRDQCVAADTPFFFKQWGGVRKKATGRELDGRTWDEQP